MNGQEEVEIGCPYCGEKIPLLIDCSAGSQEYIEDCQVCCRPIRLLVRIGAEGTLEVTSRTDSD